MPRLTQSTSVTTDFQSAAVGNPQVSPDSPGPVTTAGIVIRRVGTFVQIGMVNQQPIPGELLAQLAAPLTYQYLEYLRGVEQLMGDGSRRHVDVTTRRLYDITADGSLTTSLGFVPRLTELLRTQGCPIQFIDLSPPRTRPAAYIPDWKTVAAKFTEWRHRQHECLEMIAASLGGVIKAVPAFGKTELLGRAVILFPKARFAIVTKRRDVARTIQNRLARFTPIVGFVGDGEKRYGRVTVYIAASLHHAEPDVDFLFVDECHEGGEEQTSERLMRTFIYSRNFGLSASPEGRADGTSIRMEYLFGPEIFTLDWEEARKYGLVVPIEVHWINVYMSYDPGAGCTSDVEHKRACLWQNSVRNSLIAETVRKHPDEQVLILVETIEHAIMLWQLLPEYALCYGNLERSDAAAYVKQGLLPEGYTPLTAEQREVMRGNFETGVLRKVIATDVWSTGVSFEQLRVLVRADGMAGAIKDEQAPSRACRIHAESGKQFAIVYDFWDAFNQKCKRASAAKFARYKKKGWTQIRRKDRFE